VNNKRKDIHDRNAPYWAAALILLCLIGLSTTWVDLGTFWRGYVLDITGPAWSYILFRGLFTSYTENRWTRVFTPGNTLFIMVAVCFGIETMQYFKVYDSTFDPWDLVSYVSILVPLFLLDSYQLKKSEIRE
jgi:hypothetical protein